MTDRQGGVPDDALWRMHGKVPADQCTPIVTDDDGFLDSQRIHQSQHIIGQERHGVSANVLRHVGFAVATQVRGNHTQTRCGKRRNLTTPDLVGVGETVQQDDGWTVASCHVVHVQAIDGGV